MICSRILRSVFLLPLSLVSVCCCLTGQVRSETPTTAWTKVDVSSLPPVPSPIQEDWLVHSPDRKSNLFRSEHNELVMDNGLIRRSFLFEPNLACVGLDQLQTGGSFIRSIRPECRIGIDGSSYNVGGLNGQPVDNFLRPQWYSQLESNPDAFQLQDVHVRPLQARFPWKARTTWMANPVAWPPAGIEVRFDFAAPAAAKAIRNVQVSVHYELYDGLPLICKWLTITNASGRKIRVNHFTSEILACVEASSQVEDLAEPLYPNLHVETDFTSCSMHGASAQRDSVYWLLDPSYQTQVNYRLESKCLLECRPPQGPEVDVMDGDTFVSFRTWILANENRNEDRQSLALGRMYKTIAPWVTENPLIHHVRSANPDAVRLAIDQSAEVGFELVIMTFGSGFQIENESPEYLAQIKELADYAHGKGVALGGYSLLASRSIDAQNDVINPETGKPGGFARFGNSPCLESEWGQDYFRKLYQFYEKTGCDVLEHDGSYPGDACASHDHPGHVGYEDSRWRQWQTISQFYQWCRGRGIYLNVPDWYFLHGSSKNGMGYRETNWSLPRDYQEIIERQNIHDGTRFKLPTMGWMFVPLTEYHGGGAAATIEPLHEHLDHYERRLQNLLGAGVQACFRGPRIYDTEETKQMVKRWVDFYKQRRAILDSSLLPLRRADGRDWDGWLHVNPSLETPALAMIYNPLDREIEREIRIPLYYAGLSEMASVRIADGARQKLPLDRNETVRMKVSLPAKSAIWIEFSAAAPSK
ncbi:MAG: hypothetical protein R3C28_01330 [Pirellulaceae bacterium]